MESTVEIPAATEELQNEAEIAKADENVENTETSNNQEHRKDFTSESNKIELTNMPKFVFGVSIYRELNFILIKNYRKLK